MERLCGGDLYGRLTWLLERVGWAVGDADDLEHRAEEPAEPAAANR